MSYSGSAFSEKEKYELVVESIAVLLGDYEINRKHAAILILKALLPHSLLDSILEDDAVYPYDRNDPRVRAWTKAVLEKGKCEKCGSKDHLEAHHIIKWCDYPRGRVDPNNGQCLCHRCHTNEHIFDQSYHMMSARYE